MCDFSSIVHGTACPGTRDMSRSSGLACNGTRCWLPPFRCGARRGASVGRRSDCLDRSMPKQQVEGRPTHRHSVPRTPHACFTSHVSHTGSVAWLSAGTVLRALGPGRRRPGDVMRDKSGQQRLGRVDRPHTRWVSQSRPTMISEVDVCSICLTRSFATNKEGGGSAQHEHGDVRRHGNMALPYAYTPRENAKMAVLHCFGPAHELDGQQHLDVFRRGRACTVPCLGVLEITSSG